MSNPDMEELIASKLRDGFIHPGNKENNFQPTPIVLPLKGSAGMPKEMADLMDGTAKLLSECIISLIEGEGDSEIVPKAEIRSIRRAAGDLVATQMPVYCRCDTKRTDPLMVLTVTDP